MNLIWRGKTHLMVAIISIAISYLIVTLNYFPYFGFAVSFVIFLLFTYKFKKEKTKDTKLYLTYALIFSTLLFIRSEPVITFFNFIAVLFFGLLMLCSDINIKGGFLDFIYAPIIFILRAIFIGKIDTQFAFTTLKGGNENKRAGNIMVSILITLILISVVLPLLSSINPIFQKKLVELINIFNLENINVVIWLARLFMSFVFVLIIPRILTLIKNKYEYKMFFNINFNKLPLLIPIISLSLVLCTFFVTQLQMYFASEAYLSELGISHSERTREVFAQLSVVAGIILVLIYNFRNKNLYGKVLSGILGVQGFFLTLMAFKSVFEYIDAWGLTYKRLYGLTFASWITGIFILLIIYKSRDNLSCLFAKRMLIFSVLILFFVNILNFDYLIYHFKKSVTGQGVDYTYLSRLSPDSLSYKDQFLKLEEATKLGENLQNGYDNKNPLVILYKIKNLQNKYEKFDLRTFSLLDYLQYRQIKSIDTAILTAYYTDKFKTRFDSNEL